MKTLINVIVVLIIVVAIGAIKNFFGMEGPCEKMAREGASKEQVNACNYVQGAGH